MAYYDIRYMYCESVRRFHVADVSAISLSKRLIGSSCTMLLRGLPGQTYSFHCGSPHTHESKVLPRYKTRCSPRLPRNRRRKTATKLHSRTLHFTNQSSILYPDQQPSDYTWKHRKLENNALWTCEQRKR